MIRTKATAATLVNDEIEVAYHVDRYLVGVAKGQQRAIHIEQSTQVDVVLLDLEP